MTTSELGGLVRRRWPVLWPVLWPLVPAVIAALFAWHPLGDNDLFWHLELGRSVLAEHARTVHETLALPELNGQSIVHEWLWDALLYALQHRLGFVGVGVLVVLVSFLAGGALGALVVGWRDGERPRFVGAAGITFLVLAQVITRLNERPESAAMLFWPLGLLLASRVAATGSSRYAALLLALGLLWSQTHLSFFAFVGAATILIGPTVLESRTRLVVLVGLAMELATNAAGLEVLTVRSRLAGYVSLHVAEWQPLEWAMLNPFQGSNVPGPAYAWLVVLALIGAAGKRRSIREILLALLGLALVLQGRRGATPAALLTLPLALHGLQQRSVRIATALAGLVTLVRLHGWFGNFGTPVLDHGEFPVAAGRFLAGTGPHRAITTYRTGPYLGFVTGGAIRGLADSRTPIFTFDDADLVMARTIWSSPALVPATMDRWHFDVAVVDREMPICRALATSADWKAVLVEPQFATFVPATSPLAQQPLTQVRPCDRSYLADKLCALDDDLAVLERWDDPGFVSYLRAERAVRCAKGTFDGDAVARAIPTEAPGFEPRNDALRAWLYALAGRKREAVALLAPHVAAGQNSVLDDVLGPLVKGGADAELRAMLQPLADDDASATASITVALALTCARLHDLRCTRVEAMRSAAAGRLDVVPALCWLATQPTEHENATQWLDALSRANGTTLRCP